MDQKIKNDFPNNQPSKPNDDLIQPTHHVIDTGPNAIEGSIRNYDDDFLQAHSTKPDDVIFEELLYYTNYKKQRGDYISYDEKIQIDRYCNLLLRQLKVNRLWREEKGISNVGGYTNIPPEFYEAVDGEKLPMVNIYHKNPALATYESVQIRIPASKIEDFKKLKLDNSDQKNLNKNSTGGNVLYTIDIDNIQKNNDQQKNDVNNQSSTTLNNRPNIPNKNTPPIINNASSINRPSAAPNIPNMNKPNTPSISGSKQPPVIPNAKPKGMFDL